MKKRVVKRKPVKSKLNLDRPIAVGLFFAVLVLIMSVVAKFLFIFNGFVGFFMDLFSVWGYDLNLFGILVGVISAFVTGFVLMYVYERILKFVSTLSF